MKFSELNVCPFCGSTEFYSKQQASGTVRYYKSFDGTEVDNCQMYDSLNYQYSGKRYCADCDKYLGDEDANTVSKQVEEAFRKMNASCQKNKTLDR